MAEQNLQRPLATPATRSADRCWHAITHDASALYRATDAHAHRFARAKLGGDAVFRQILERGLVAPGDHVLDLGCGQGLLAGLLHAAEAVDRRGDWPAEWSRAPRQARVTGIDPLAHDIARASAALGPAANFVQGDMRDAPLPPCDVVVFLDTLHYIGRAQQDAVLQRACQALRPGGRMLLRVHDAAAPWRYAFGLWVDRITMRLHGGGWGALTGRTREGWMSSLEALGLSAEVMQMNGRPPFANLLIVARRPARALAAGVKDGGPGLRPD